MSGGVILLSEESVPPEAPPLEQATTPVINNEKRLSLTNLCIGNFIEISGDREVKN